MLNLTKTAVGVASVQALATRNAARTRDWQGSAACAIYTRYRPKDYERLVGGSLFWIIKHVISVRQEILGFEQATWKGKPGWRIWLAPEMKPVSPRRKRAHQGWRYLKPEDAPIDLGGGDADLGEMPVKMAQTLARLGLI
ncbi:DUF1489 domain-containing protein [Pacificimonas sp. WHA3]|uniref:DUF1489 domain-containing protein n=1 Tax=Pacificimonas pallii TaxID=2827236 RepID=A0ABS6SD89_9SPHN|nr:DUF1489 domain-containing protein [Pacificimonas pallii]